MLVMIDRFTSATESVWQESSCREDSKINLAVRNWLSIGKAKLKIEYKGMKHGEAMGNAPTLVR